MTSAMAPGGRFAAAFSRSMSRAHDLGHKSVIAVHTR
jgi:hypothetical protein